MTQEIATGGYLGWLLAHAHWRKRRAQLPVSWGICPPLPVHSPSSSRLEWPRTQPGQKHGRSRFSVGDQGTIREGQEAECRKQEVFSGEHPLTYTLTHHGIQELDAASQFRSRLAELSEEQAAYRLPLTQADVVPLCGGIRRNLHVITGHLQSPLVLQIEYFVRLPELLAPRTVKDITYIWKERPCYFLCENLLTL